MRFLSNFCGRYLVDKVLCGRYLVDIRSFFWWSIFDKTPVAGLIIRDNKKQIRMGNVWFAQLIFLQEHFMREKNTQSSKFSFCISDDLALQPQYFICKLWFQQKEESSLGAFAKQLRLRSAAARVRICRLYTRSITIHIHPASVVGWRKYFHFNYVIIHEAAIPTQRLLQIKEG